MGPFTDDLHSGAKYEASAVYEHKAYMTACDPSLSPLSAVPESCHRSASTDGDAEWPT
jgi:hypothetical protein